MPADGQLQAMELRLKLRPPFRPDEGVQFVDHDVPQRAEESRDLRTPQNEESFEGLGCDEEDARGLAQQIALFFARHVAVPTVHGHVDRAGQCCKADRTDR